MIPDDKPPNLQPLQSLWDLLDRCASFSLSLWERWCPSPRLRTGRPSLHVIKANAQNWKLNSGGCLLAYIACCEDDHERGHTSASTRTT